MIEYKKFKEHQCICIALKCTHLIARQDLILTAPKKTNHLFVFFAIICRENNPTVICLKKKTIVLKKAKKPTMKQRPGRKITLQGLFYL